MPVITYVRIENFRSIRSIELDGLDDYAPIVGLNSSGKSNILRALNLFFNDFVDEFLTPVDMAVDYSSNAPKRKKKAISVTIGLAVNDELKVRGQAAFQAKYGITKVIYVRRTWTLAFDKVSIDSAYDFGASRDMLQNATLDDLASVITHVRSVRYVYIPNHTRPSDLIEQELAPLRPTLVARLRASKAYKAATIDALMDELRSMGDRMFGDVSTAMQRGLPSTKLRADLPSDFAELAFTVGMTATTDGGVARAPEFEGSGAQSFMLLHVLDLVDRTRRSGGFGWVQGSIWAIEEPESFLHAGLRAQFSLDLKAYATDSRRQVLVTTHQDEFVRVSAQTWLTGKTASATTVRALTPREALMETTKRAITTFRHPLFTYPDVPVVIVEGKWDALHLRAAIAAAGIRPRWRLVEPTEFLSDKISGDAVQQYLKYNKQVVASRPDSAPVFVLRDWEASAGNKEAYDKILAVHAFSECLIPPQSLTNPELNESFVGIERFLPTAVIKSVVSAKKLGLEHAGTDARYTIVRSDLESAKAGLGRAIDGGADSGPFMVSLAEWLDQAVSDVLDAVPLSAFT